MRVSVVTSFLARAIATAGGAGYSPVAPGTCGTLVAVPIAWMCRGTDTLTYLGVAVLVIVVGIAAAHRADQVWRAHDSQRIVIDEVAGYLLTVALVDRSSGWALAAGFVVFRALDIVKPPPIRWVDRHVGGGVGVMLDDVAAGAVGAAIVVALAYAGAWSAVTMA